MQSDVLIIGAGPVGLTLALDLGRRGINTILVESKDAPLRLPKMERTNPRTMEIFRRLGVSEMVRQRGLGPDKSMDVFIVETLAKEPFARLEYPNVNTTRELIAACNDGSLPREPYQLISQYTLEPLLFERLEQFACVTVLRATDYLTFKQDADGVHAEIRDRGNGSIRTVSSRYLVAADGAGSTIRQQLGIAMEGRTQLGTVTNVFFRCDDFFEKCQLPQARHYAFAAVSTGGGAGGSLIVQDDQKHFAFHTTAAPDTDMVALLRDVTAVDIHPEILHVGPWTQNMLVAQRHSEGRVFLAGDANHIYIPAGGLGMNTGIVDAINLSWKLAATIAGWGGPNLLQSYSAERNRTARRTLGFVQYAVEGAVKMRELFNPLALEPTAEGRQAREQFAAGAAPLLRRVYEMHGADLGYRYESPIISVEQGEPPADDAYHYKPTTWPGAHAPHVWLEPGVALFDRLGGNHTLLRLGETKTDSCALESAFRALGVPLDVLEISSPAVRQVYERDFVLLRPDLHVAWRGNVLPDDVSSLARQVAGY